MRIVLYAEGSADRGSSGLRKPGARCSVDDPEALDCREAKDRLGSWMGERVEGPSAAEEKRKLRIRLAEECDLAEVAARCRSFERFRSELGEKVR